MIIHVFLVWCLFRKICLNGKNYMIQGDDFNQLTVNLIAEATTQLYLNQLSH